MGKQPKSKTTLKRYWSIVQFYCQTRGCSHRSGENWTEDLKKELYKKISGHLNCTDQTIEKALRYYRIEIEDYFKTYQIEGF